MGLYKRADSGLVFSWCNLYATKFRNQAKPQST
jgi:hypothetical protein